MERAKYNLQAKYKTESGRVNTQPSVRASLNSPIKIKTSLDKSFESGPKIAYSDHGITPVKV